MNRRRGQYVESCRACGIFESGIAIAPRLLWSIRGVAHCLVLTGNLREIDR